MKTEEQKQLEARAYRMILEANRLSVERTGFGITELSDEEMFAIAEEVAEKFRREEN